MSSRSNFPTPEDRRPVSRSDQGASHPDFEEDPLVELARIVSESSGDAVRYRKPFPEPAPEPAPQSQPAAGIAGRPEEAYDEPQQPANYWQDQPLRGGFDDRYEAPAHGQGGAHAEGGVPEPQVPSYGPDYGEGPGGFERGAEAYDQSAYGATEEIPQPVAYDDQGYESYPQDEHRYSGHPEQPIEEAPPPHDYAEEVDEYAAGIGGHAAPVDDLTAGFEDELRSAFDRSVGERVGTAPPQTQAYPEPDDGFDDLFEAEAPQAVPVRQEPARAAVPPHATAPAPRMEPAYPAEDDYYGAEDDGYYEEAAPPEGGYDLDAVARAMKESDPGLSGHGVLPPHSEAESRAAPDGFGRRRGLTVAAAVLGLAVIGGAAFAVIDFGGQGVDIGPPPVIAAQEGELKVYPTSDEPKEQSQSKLIYDRVRGVESTGEERLVLPEDTPVASLPPAPAPSDTTSPSGLPRTSTPKRVRTVIVKPDGTIISGDDGAQESTETAAVEEPTLPSTVGETAAQSLFDTRVSTTAEQPAPKPSEDTSTAEPATDEPSQSAASAADEEDVPSAQSGAEGGVLPRPKPEDAPRVVASAPASPNAQAPASSSNNSGPLDLTSQQQQAAAPAQQTQQPAPSASGQIPAGAYIVQVSSQRSEELARQAFEGLQNRYPSVLGSVTPVIQRADLGDRGVFYRVRIPTSSRDEAIGLCENLKAAGGDCFVRQN